MNAEIKRERERESYFLSLSLFFLLLSSFVASLHFLTAWSVRVYHRSFIFHTHTKRQRVRSKRCNYSDHWRDYYSFSLNKNRVFRRKALTISTHRTSFSRFWRSSLLQLLVINRFIDEYAICMYACFTRMIYIIHKLCYILPQPEQQRKKKRKKKMRNFLSMRLYTPYTLEKFESRNPEQKNTKKKVTRIISRARTTNERHWLLLLCTRCCCIRHARPQVSRPDRWDFPEPFLACINYDVTLVRFDYAHLHARTLTRTHTRY